MFKNGQYMIVDYACVTLSHLVNENLELWLKQEEKVDLPAVTTIILASSSWYILFIVFTLRRVNEFTPKTSFYHSKKKKKKTEVP